MSRITQIYQNGKENDKYDIGATFENVTYDYKNSNNEIKRFTLKDLYGYLKKFFNNGTFVKYSKSEPWDERIKVWYDTLYERDDTYYLDNNSIIEATKDTLKQYITGRNSMEWSGVQIVVREGEKEAWIPLSLLSFEDHELKIFTMPTWSNIMNKLGLNEEDEEPEKIMFRLIYLIPPLNIDPEEIP